MSWKSPALRSTVFLLAVFLLCVGLIDPLLESGMTDDWSTVRTAQLLAQTGHIVYNGWEAALLGWPLYVAALFARFFGPSFTSIRASNLLEAVLALVLLHRTFLRAGLNVWNATFGALTLALTPIFLLASIIFMTDVPGLLAFLVCFYACVRALQASSEDAAALWISVAALGNTVLGTSRQVAWLGALVMVPCALWLMRRQRRVLVAGALSCLVSWGAIAFLMHWFAHQPYVLHASLLPSRHLISISKELQIALRTLLDLVLFTLPVAFAFLPAGRRLPRRAWFAVAVLALLFLGGLGLVAHVHQFRRWLAPFLLFPYVHPQTIENTFTMTSSPMKGPVPALLSRWPRVLVTGAVLLGTFSVLFGILSLPRKQRSARESLSLSWPQLLWLTLPTTLVYLGFLISRGTYNFVYDRYFIPILPFVLLWLLLWYQQHEAERLPLAAGLVIVASGAYSVVSLHDAYATYRAALRAANEVLAAGYRRPDLDAGWEFNHYTQILVGGFVHQEGVRLPDGSLLGNLDVNRKTPCSMDVSEWVPDVRPRFALAFPGAPCAPVPEFTPVHFHTWLAPRNRTVQIVRYNTHDHVEPQEPEY